MALVSVGQFDPNQTNTSWALGSTLFRSTAGRVQVDPRSSVSTRVIITLGQSTIAGTEDAVHTIVNAGKVLNLNVEDGGVYQAQDPLLGQVLYTINGTGGTWTTRFADKLITDGTFERIILVPIAIGGARVSEWAKLPTVGPLYQRLRAALYRCAALGYTSDMIDIFWQQGESDNVLNTATADYQFWLQSAINGVREEGFSSRWFVAQCSYYQGVTDESVRAAQAAVVNGVDIFSLGDSDGIGDEGRWDTTHFNAVGSDMRADVALAAYYAAG